MPTHGDRRPAGKTDLLTAQLGDFQPEGRQAAVAPDSELCGRMLPGMCGARLTVARVDAKSKYDDDHPIEHRERVIDNLQKRHDGLGSGAAAQQRRRLDAIGEWRSRRNQD